MIEIKGDIIQLGLSGDVDVIVHGCNCFCVMASGLAPQMAKAFGADHFPLEHPQYRGNIDKLGRIDFRKFYISKEGDVLPIVVDMNNYPQFSHHLTVVNAYTQYDTRKPSVYTIPLDYDALNLSIRKINHTFKGKRVAYPKIGCGIAGGNWDIVRELIITQSPDVDLTLIEL